MSCRVVIVGDAAQFHLRRWANYFADSGWNVSVLTWNGDTLPGFRYEVLVIPKSPKTAGAVARALQDAVTFIRFRRALRKLKPDVVHVFSLTSYAFATSVASPAPYIVTPVGTDILLELPATGLWRTVLRRALLRAARVHSDGFNVHAELLRLGVPSDTIYFGTYGVDLRRFPESRRDRRPTGEKTVVSTRRLEPVHDVRALVEAAPEILRACPGTRFVIGGTGSQEESLKHSACELGLQEHFRFMGFLEEPDLVRTLMDADLYVSTSVSESGLAASTAEAMAAGLPVVTTDVGDARRWIVGSRNGIVVPPGDPAALADAIIRLLRDDELARNLGRNNREVVEQSNNLENEMARFGQLYESVARGGTTATEGG